MMELAMIVTVLSVIIVGAIDFGKISYMAMALTHAAREGAMVGSQTAANSTKFTEMQNAAIASAQSDIGTISANASRSCSCDVGGTVSPMGTCTSACAGSVQIRVSVTATKTFTMRATIVGLVKSVSLSRTAIMRAQ
jgi:Flp pilus assembly protein TadG